MRHAIAFPLACLVALAFVLAPLTARAEPAQTFVSPGATYSVASGDHHGFGAEVSVVHYPASQASFALGRGAYVRYEDAANGTHLSLGPQLNYAIFGLEAGLSYREGGSTPAALGVQIAPFLSTGLVYVSAPLSYLPAAGRGPAPGFLYGVTVGIKIPLPLVGGYGILPRC